MAEWTAAGPPGFRQWDAGVTGQRGARRPNVPAGVPPSDSRGRSSGAPGDDVPHHLLPVLRQLLTGATDVRASRRLGVSPRTFSRRVSELLDHLGVDSRFQAGVASAQLGLVTARRTAPRPEPGDVRTPMSRQNHHMPNRTPWRRDSEGRPGHV